MVEYDFTEGLYRAFVRTGYKNGNNEIESIDGNKVEFRSDYISPIPVITSVVIAPNNTSITISWTSDSSPDQVMIYRVSTAEKVWEHHTRFSPCEVDWVWGTGNFYVQIISGNGFSSEPWYFTIEQPYYKFSTNQNIKIDPTTLEVPNASLARTKSMYGLTYDLYDNGLLVISGNMTEPRDDPYNDMNYFIGYNLEYIYFAGKNAYYEELFGISFYSVKEIAFYAGYYYRTDTQSAARMFENCTSLLNIDFGTGFYTYYVTDMTEMFASCFELQTLDFTQAYGFYASKVTSTAYMFDSCSKLTSINFGTNFTTLKLTMATGMFLRCTSLTSLDLSDWANITKLEFADDMFAGCSALTSINLGALSIMSTTSGYYSIESMFEGCSSLISIDAARIRVKYVTNADNAFKGCSSLTYLDCSSWRPNQAYIGNNGFIDGCTALEYFSCFSPRQQITLPKTMYDSSGNAYNSLPYTTSTSDRFTVYATNPNAPKSAPKMLMSRSGGEVTEESRDFVEYNFAKGFYRAFIRTGYKDALMTDNFITGNKYRFYAIGRPIPPIWQLTKDLNNYDNATSQSGSGRTWPHTIVYDPETNTNTVTTTGQTYMWERLQFILPTIPGAEIRMSFKYCTPSGTSVVQSWGKLVMATANKATPDIWEPAYGHFQVLGSVDLTNNSSSNNFVTYEFTFTPLHEETYIIFDFSGDRDSYTYTQKFKDIELTYV